MLSAKRMVTHAPQQGMVQPGAHLQTKSMVRQKPYKLPSTTMPNFL